MFARSRHRGGCAAPRLVFAQARRTARAAPAGPFTLPPLTYAFNVFEPHIDAKTMEIHHGQHHAAYVANLNNVAKTNPQLGTAKIEDVLGNLNALDDGIKFTVRNNLGGHANHTMFWEIMGPNGGKPEGEVLAAIDKDLGGMEKFQNDFNAAGGRQFGSGWVFVTVTKDGKLAIETPPQPGRPGQGRPARTAPWGRLGAPPLSLPPRPPRRFAPRLVGPTLSTAGVAEAATAGTCGRSPRLTVVVPPRRLSRFFGPLFLFLVRSTRSRFVIFYLVVHAATKSFTNFSFESAHA